MLECGRNANEQGGKVQELARSCKFYMGFENTVLQDYVTEKFFEGFQPLAHNGKLITIYRGAPNMKYYGFPNTSFIDYHSYKSATDLALEVKPYCDNERFKQYYSERLTPQVLKDVEANAYRLHLQNVSKSPCKVCSAVGEMKLSRFLLFKLGLTHQLYRVGISEFEQFIKHQKYDSELSQEQLQVLWDIYERAYGRLWREGNDKSNWNDFDLNYVAY